MPCPTSICMGVIHLGYAELSSRKVNGVLPFILEVQTPPMWSLAHYHLILLVLEPEYSGRTGLIPWLLMPWLLVSPGHQQQWYWLCRKNNALVFHKRGFPLLACKCRDMIENVNMLHVSWKTSAWPGLMTHHLTRCGLVTPHGDIHLGQQWLR